MQATSIEASLSYMWAGNHGLLAEINGAAKYLADTGEAYLCCTHKTATESRWRSCGKPIADTDLNHDSGQ